MTEESSFPTPAEIKAARMEAGLTQQESADMMGVHLRSWQRWEYGKREMSPAYFEMYLIMSKESEPVSS